jgi:3-methyl-2-oxobutanoate hydroxymethyltransferase
VSTAVKAGKRKTIPDLAARKGGEPIVSLTAYTTPMAKLLDEHVDFLLVGDSMGMAVYGMDNTLGVTLDMAINHGAAVVRGTKYACVVVDMPFGTYQESLELAFRNAAKVMADTGCAAIKIEGGREMADTVKFLVERGIPVMGHVGLKPQSVNVAGGFRSQGRDDDGAKNILADANAISDAGAFAIVVEAVVESLAKQITEEVSAVTIGIGGSNACDGQILVTEDAIGMITDFTPKFVKHFAEVGEEISKAAQAYAKEVKARTFPGPEHCYNKKS